MVWLINQEAFSYLLEWNIQGEDGDFYTIDCIFTLGVKHNCLERLVKWLQEEIGIFEVLDGYLLQIDDNYQKLSPTEEEIDRIMLRVLDCSPADLPKPKSVLLQNWLLSFIKRCLEITQACYFRFQNGTTFTG